MRCRIDGRVIGGAGRTYISLPVYILAETIPIHASLYMLYVYEQMD